MATRRASCTTATPASFEVTFGILGQRGDFTVLTPSLLVKGGDVRSYEEKYGTGGTIALTPPPPELIGQNVLEVCPVLKLQRSLHSAVFCDEPARHADSSSLAGF